MGIPALLFTSDLLKWKGREKLMFLGVVTIRTKRPAGSIPIETQSDVAASHYTLQTGRDNARHLMWLHLFRKYIRRRGGKKHVLASWRWLDASSSLLLLVIEENSTRNCRDVEIGNKKLGMRIPRESTRQTRNFPQLFLSFFKKV